MRRIIVVLIFISLCFSVVRAGKVKINHFSNAGLHRIYSELEISKPEYFEIAKEIEEFRKGYWKFKGSEERLKSINKLEKRTSSKKVFTPFNQWFKKLADIHKSNSAGETQEICENISLDHDALLDKTKGICHLSFLYKLGDEIKSGEYLTARHIQYIKTNFERISGMHRHIIKFLDKTKKNLNVGQIVIKEFKELYEKNPSYKISRKLAGKLKIKKVAKKAQKKENFSISDDKYKGLTTNISKVIGLIDVDAPEEKILERTKDTVLSYYTRNEDLLPQKDSHERIIKLAQYFTRRKKYTVARELFNFIDKKSNEFEEEIHFGYLWSYIQKKESTQALVYIRYNKLDKLYKNHSSKLNYWVAKVLNERNDSRSAKNILDFIIKNNPLSYYAIMSAKKLNDISGTENFDISNHPYHSSLHSAEHDFKVDPELLPQHIIYTFQRLQLFAALDNSPLMRKELDEIFDSLQEMRLLFPKATLTDIKADFSLLTAHILYKNEKYLETFKLVYKGIDKRYLTFTPQVIKMLFPKPYINEIRKKLGNKDIDPMMVISLMRQESSFNPAARSPVGALGLMQLMPATARRFKKRVKKKQLHESGMNIDLGTQYISYLMDRFENNVIYTLAAYNAGEGKVDYWKKNYFKEESVLMDIENIPFTETRKYVKLIYRNIFLYKFINAQDKLSDASNPNEIFDLSLNYPEGPQG